MFTVFYEEVLEKSGMLTNEPKLTNHNMPRRFDEGQIPFSIWNQRIDIVMPTSNLWSLLLVR